MIYVIDKDIGGICDILFDDDSFVICYLVVDINIWLLLSCKVVIFFILVFIINFDYDMIDVVMDVEIFKNSLIIDEYKLVFREYEEMLFCYFGYGYYWIGSGVWGDFFYLIEFVDFKLMDEVWEDLLVNKENYFCVCGEVLGYEVVIIDDNVGYICDFVVDIWNWVIWLLVVDINNWLSGGKKLVFLFMDIF